MKKLLSLTFVFIIAGITSCAFSQWDEFAIKNPENFRQAFFKVTEVKVKDSTTVVKVTLPAGSEMNKDHCRKSGDTVTFYPVFVEGGTGCRESQYKIKQSSYSLDDDEDEYEVWMSLYNDPKQCVPQKGDLVQLSSLFKRHNKLLLELIGDDAIKINSSSGTTILPRKDGVNSVFQEWEAIVELMGDLKSYSGSEILQKATSKDIIDFLNFTVSFPRKLMGNSWGFIGLYERWIKANQPKGNLNEVDLYTKYEVLKMTKIISVDLEKGLVGGINLSSFLEDPLSKYPFFDDSWLSKTPNCHDYVHWFSCGNMLMMRPGQKYLEIRTGHKGIVDGSLFLKKIDEIKKVFGEPVIVSKEDKDDSYFFKVSYGTMNFIFATGENKANRIRIYPLSPDEIVECK